MGTTTYNGSKANADGVLLSCDPLGDVEETPEGFSNDFAGGGLVGFGSGFDGCFQLWVDPNGYDIGWS